jgi:hypothetical protein
LANHNYIGQIPGELEGLTIAKEMMIVKCHVKCFILHLHEETDSIPNAQHGLKGDVIIFPQKTSPILMKLPPPVENVVTPICVLFVGSHSLTPEWLRQHARPLIVRREKIRNALRWLQQHNYLYHDINIDNERLASLDDEDILPVHIETVSEESDKAQDVLTSHYDTLGSVSPMDSLPGDIRADQESTQCNSQDTPCIFEHVIVTDVDANAPSH